MIDGQTTTIVVIVVALFMIYRYRSQLSEQFTVPHASEAEIDPECANAKPMDLVRLYKGQTERMANDLRSTGLDVATLSDPTKYPLILNTLKKMKLIASCSSLT